MALYFTIALFSGISEEADTPVKFQLHTPKNIKHSKSARWTKEEDELLQKYVNLYSSNWKLIAETITSFKCNVQNVRSELDCYQRACKLFNIAVDENVVKETKNTVDNNAEATREDRVTRFTKMIERFESIHKNITNKRKDIQKPAGI